MIPLLQCFCMAVSCSVPRNHTTRDNSFDKLNPHVSRVLIARCSRTYDLSREKSSRHSRISGKMHPALQTSTGPTSTPRHNGPEVNAPDHSTLPNKS